MAGSDNGAATGWLANIIQSHNSRAWALIGSCLLVLITQIADLNILLSFLKSGDYGWFGIAFCFLLAAWIVAGLFTSIESWLDPYARTSLVKFFIGFFQLHIPLSTIIAYRKTLEVQALKNHTKRSRSSETPATHANIVMHKNNAVMDVFYQGCQVSGPTGAVFLPAGRTSLRKVSACMDPETLRSTRINLLWESRQAAQSAKLVQQAADWLRMVECLFETIPGIMLQCYIAVLARKASTFGLVVIICGIISVSVNTAIIVGADQPVLRQLALFAHVLAQMAMRTIVVAWLAVAQGERSIPVFVAYAMCSLLFSLYIYNSMGSVISNLFAVPLFLLAWDTTRTRNSDIFGWRRLSALDSKTTMLRLFICWRFLENVAGVLVVVYFTPINPCTRFGNVRYESQYCVTCCRGPIVYGEVLLAMFVSAIIYIASWVAGWYLDNVTYAQENIAARTAVPTSKPEISATSWLRMPSRVPGRQQK